jgi:hypothetical protein
MDIFRHCLRILERRQNEQLRGWRRDAADACETVLNYLRIHATLLTNDDIAVELRRHCLKYMEDHYLYPLHLAHVAEKDGRSEGERARRRIDKMYRMHASATKDPWLWDDWAAAAIHVVRARAFAQPDQEVTQKRYLIDVQAEVDRAIALHPAADAVAVRTLLYLWHFEECLDRAMRVLEQPLSGRVRLRVVRLNLDLLAPLTLEPPILRYWIPPEPYRTRLVSIYKQLLQEHAAMVGRSQARHWTQAAISVLDGKLNTEGWSELIEPLQQRMGGSLKVCWQTVIDQTRHIDPALGEPKHGLLELLDDLTDATSIFLVGILLRFGASDESLPRPLRQKLAELAIISGAYAESWERSVRLGPLSVDVTLHGGYAIAMALTLSGDGTVFGESESGLMSHRGRNLTWHEVMNNYFSATISNAIGRFRSFVKEVHRTLRMKINAPVT